MLLIIIKLPKNYTHKRYNTTNIQLQKLNTFKTVLSVFMFIDVGDHKNKLSKNV